MAKRTGRRAKSANASSSALLTLRASVAFLASLAADASPTPPTFLCPSLGCDQPPSPSHTPDTSPPRRRRTRGRTLPIRYDQGDDGQWRRVESYTLYGSTVCTSNCAETQASAPVASTSTSTSTSSPPATSTPTMLDQLPAGWIPKSKPKDTNESLILALSLVLAFAICFLIITCLFWRKSRRRAKYLEDGLEMKVIKKRRKRGRGEDLSPMEKEIKAKQRLWVRASARWRANARSARRRRGPASVYNGQHDRSSVSLSLDQVEPIEPPPETTRQGDPESLPADARSLDASNSGRESSVSPHTSVLELPLDETPPPMPQPDRPPAYVQPTGAAGSVSDSKSESPVDYSPGTSASRFVVEGESSSTTGLSHTGHVATDDKTALAQLASMASEPNSSLGGRQSGEIPSAPAWQDEDAGNLLARPSSNPVGSTLPTMNSAQRNLFPPPPEKGKAAASTNFYDYRYEYDDLRLGMSLNETDLPSPSAPPFEEDASAPSFQDLNSAASAPPLLEDGDEHGSSYGSCSVPTIEERVDDVYSDNGDMTRRRRSNGSFGQNHDRVRAEERFSANSIDTLPRYLG